jgi:polysaccharide biosynthesis transport protein
VNAARALRLSCAVFRKRAWIIAAVVILAAASAVHPFATRAPRYQAEASLLVRPHMLASPTFEDPGLSAIQGAYRKTVVNDLIQLLRSRTISERVAERVGGLTPRDLAQHVTAWNIRDTDFLIIRGEHEQPEQAALIANALAEELASFYAEMNRQEATGQRQFVEEQQGLAQERLKASEQAVVEFRTRTGAAALPEDVSRTAQRILDLQAARDAALVDEAAAQARVAAIRSRLASQKDGQLAAISIATNPVIAQIRDHLTGLELELASLRQVYTDQHPKVQALLGRIAEDQQSLRAEAAKALNDTSLGTSPIREQFVREMINAEVDTAAARSRAAGISPILDRLQASFHNVSDTELTLARLQREVRNAEQLIIHLSSLHEDALIREHGAAVSGQAAIVLVDPALAPDRPMSPPLPQAATLGGLLGLCVGAALALAVERWEGRIRPLSWPAGAPGGLGVAPLPVVGVRRSRYAAALGLAGLVLPMALMAVVVLTLGVAAGVAGILAAQTGTMPPSVAHLGQALLQAFQTVQQAFQTIQ